MRHEMPLTNADGKRPDIERVDVSEPASISSGIAARYATAVFELAKDDNTLPALEADIGALEAAIAASADMKGLISSPLYSRVDQAVRQSRQKVPL